MDLRAKAANDPLRDPNTMSTKISYGPQSERGHRTRSRTGGVPGRTRTYEVEKMGDRRPPTRKTHNSKRRTKTLDTSRDGKQTMYRSSTRATKRGVQGYMNLKKRGPNGIQTETFFD